MTRLCKVLRESGHLHNLLDLLTMVNQQVSDWDEPKLKQASFISSSLCANVKFHRQEDKLVETVLDIYENRLFEISCNFAFLRRVMNFNQQPC